MMDDLAESLRSEIARLESALQTIAGGHWERWGMDQTDIDEVPDLSGEDAMNLARDVLSLHPMTPAPQGDL